MVLVQSLPDRSGKLSGQPSQQYGHINQSINQSSIYITASTVRYRHQTFKHVCTLVADVTGRAHLRSAVRRDMLVPRTRTELDRRSFQVAAPTVWNSLPAHLRSTLISRRQFRDGLKSHLFTEAYFWSSENICFKSVIYLLTYLPLHLRSATDAWAT